jgi:hypothetical protein
MPHKSDLRFFVEKTVGEVKGFDGKAQMALGIGSVALMDATGNRIILHDVCYVPGIENRILSMMKFRKDHKTDFQFTGPETFSTTAAKGFKLTGHSVNDILYITIPQIQANVTANIANAGTVKRQIDEVSSDTDSASAISEASELERPPTSQPHRHHLQLAPQWACGTSDSGTLLPLHCANSSKSNQPSIRPSVSLVFKPRKLASLFIRQFNL